MSKAIKAAKSASDDVELIGIYNIMGEGLVAELLVNSSPMLYDKRGLQYRIVSLQKEGKETRVEEQALAQINSLGAYSPFSELPRSTR